MVYGLGCTVSGLEFRVEGLGIKVWNSAFMVQGEGFSEVYALRLVVKDSGSRVQDLGFRL
jgi:hypothetical protein